MSTSIPSAPVARRSLRRRLRLLAAKLTLSAVVFAMCLLLGEGAVRLLGFQPVWNFYSKPTVFWRHDELLGWSHTPNSRGSYVGPKPWPIEFNTPVEINSDGLRGPEVAPMPDHGRRVLFIGDSMLAGFEVVYEKTFPMLIGAELTRTLGVPVQVINAGVRGYGTDQSYLYFRERGNKYRPDAVVLIQSANDFRENTEVHRMTQPLGKPAFRLSPDGSLVLLGHPVPNYPICSQFNVTPQFELVRTDTLFHRAWCGIQTRVLDYSALGAVVTYGLARHPRLLTAIYRGTQPRAAFHVAEALEEQSYQLTEALLRALGSEVVRVSGRNLLVTGEDISLEGVDWRRVADVIDVFSYEEIWRDRKDEIMFKNDGHLTELGHERVAGLVAPRLAALLAQPASRAQVAGH